MIQKSQQSDITQILDIWLNASIKAHGFIKKEFWESKIPDMRDIYLPSTETYVYHIGGSIKGFVSLNDNTIEALFVSPKFQGQGIGKQLINKSKGIHNSLKLTVYKENQKSIQFYKKCGFKTIVEQIDDQTGHPELLMAFNFK